MKSPKSYRSSKLRAHLNFNDGYAEMPIYSIKAITSEKDKGLNMIDLIMDNFNIISVEVEEHRRVVRAQILKEMNHLNNKIISPPIKLNRDERGNLVSPFASKQKW